MQLSGMLKPVKRVILHNHITGEAYKGFEMELSGKLTCAIEEGSLRDEIERAGGIYVIAALSPSGSISLKYIPFADALSAEELEKRAEERDQQEMDSRKAAREAEVEDRLRRNDETMRDGIRMELSDRARIKAERQQEVAVRTNATTAVQAPAVSDDEVEKEFKARQTSKKSTTSESDLADTFSPIAGELDADGKPLPAKGKKPKKTARKKRKK